MYIIYHRDVKKRLIDPHIQEQQNIQNKSVGPHIQEQQNIQNKSLGETFFTLARFV